MRKKRFWTPQEDQYLKENFADNKTEELCAYLERSYSSVAQRGRYLGLKKSASFFSDLVKSGRINMVANRHSFKKGSVPWNKGGPFKAGGRSAETRFKKGNLPHNTKEDGAITIRHHKRGFSYKYVRVSLGEWKLLHRVLWAQEYGEIPKGYNVQFKDGDTMNCSIENLHLVSRKKNMTQNTIHRYPDEVKTAIRTLSKLNKQINKNEEQTNRPE